MLLKEFFVKIGLDADFANFTKAQMLVNGLQAALSKLVDVGNEALHFLPDLADQFANHARDVDLAAQKTGINAQALQELSYAGRAAGISMEGVVAASGHLARMMSEAKKGTGDSAEAFSKLGVKLTGADGKLRGAQDVIGDIADAFQKLPDGTEKTALVLHTFGRAGMEMVPLLNMGREGIAKFRKEAEDLGVVLDADSIKMGKDLFAANQKLGGSLEGLKNAIIGPLIPEFIKIVNSKIAWIKANKVLIAQLAQKAFYGFLNFAKSLVNVLGGLYDIAKYIVGVVGDLVRGFYTLGPVLGTVITVIAAMTTAMVLFGTTSTLAMLPILALASLIAFVYLLFEDLVVGMKGGKSVIFELFDAWEGFLRKWASTEKPDDNWLVKTLKLALDTLLNLQTHWTAFKDLFSEDGATALGDYVLGSAGHRRDHQTSRGAVSEDDLYRYTQITGQGPTYVPGLSELNAYRRAQKSLTVGDIHVHASGDAKDIASTVVKTIETFWDTKMREGAASTP